MEPAMFTFEYWLTGIVSTCELIASKDAFYRTLILGDHSITSIHYYDELLEQLIGDLHLEECIGLYEGTLRKDEAFDAVSGFAAALRLLDQSVATHSDLREAKVFLASEEWAAFQNAAKQVLALPVAQSYLGRA